MKAFLSFLFSGGQLPSKTSPDLSLMACSTTGSNQAIHETDDAVSRSYFQRTVCLYDWWLIKAEEESNGKRLAVAGLTSREQPLRLFSSAPITKRFDVFTLETADGICVKIKGFINKLRTEDNGFSDEVFKRFVIGFPPSWEEYAENCFEGEPTDAGLQGGNQTETRSLLLEKSPSEEDKPVQKVSCDNSVSSSDKLSNPDGGSKRPPLESSQKYGKMGERQSASTKAFVHQSGGNLNYSSAINVRSAGKVVPVDTLSQPVGRITRSLYRNTGIKKQNKEPITASGLNTEKDHAKLIAVGSDHVTDQSGDVIVYNVSEMELDVPTSGNTINNDEDHRPKEDRYLQKHDANQVNYYGEVMTQSNKGNKKTKRSAGSPSGMVNTNDISDIDDANREPKRGAKEYTSSGNRVKKKINFNSPASPVPQAANKKASVFSPESLNYRRSRSGRLLVPTLEFWRNQIPVYDAEHNLTGIQEGLAMSESNRGTRSEPRKNPRKQT